MQERLRYHFEPQTGWMNDPNGLIYFQGKYHAFFQHYPFAPRWGQMHWGHAVSEDLIHWEELPIALYPDQPYENSGGCYSGSAVEQDGVLYLFYTSVSHEMGQTQSIAMSRDGIHFEKYEQNPVIAHYPPDGSADFRDPKVTKIEERYCMVCGSGKDGVGKVLLYESEDLLHWGYAGVLLEGSQYGAVLECPDFFPLGEHYVLMFSKMGLKTHSTQFIVGDFRDNRFYPLFESTAEAGPQFYAPQTFAGPEGQRIMIGWMYDWSRQADENVGYAGALTVPRVLTLGDNKVLNYPVPQAAPLLTMQDDLVCITDGGLFINLPGNPFHLPFEGEIHEISVLRDTGTMEVFLNHGEASCTLWLY